MATKILIELFFRLNWSNLLYQNIHMLQIFWIDIETFVESPFYCYRNSGHEVIKTLLQLFDKVLSEWIRNKLFNEFKLIVIVRMKIYEFIVKTEIFHFLKWNWKSILWIFVHWTQIEISHLKLYICWGESSSSLRMKFF